MNHKKLTEIHLEALAHARAFIRAECTALEFEARLLALGFYNVRFHPTEAAFNGVVYPLTLKELINV